MQNYKVKGMNMTGINLNSNYYIPQRGMSFFDAKKLVNAVEKGVKATLPETKDLLNPKKLEVLSKGVTAVAAVAAAYIVKKHFDGEKNKTQQVTVNETSVPAKAMPAAAVKEVTEQDVQNKEVMPAVSELKPEEKIVSETPVAEEIMSTVTGENETVTDIMPVEAIENATTTELMSDSINEEIPEETAENEIVSEVVSEKPVTGNRTAIEDTNAVNSVKKSHQKESENTTDVSVLTMYMNDVKNSNIEILSKEEETELFKNLRANEAEVEKINNRIKNSALTEKNKNKLVKKLREKEKEIQLIKERIVEANLKLVVYFAQGWQRYFKKQGKECELTDLIQEGNIGLMDAVSKFDYKRSAKFSTYAKWWISQRIERFVAEQGSVIRIPVNKPAEVKQYLKIIENMKSNSQKIDDKTIMQETGLTPKSLKTLMQAEAATEITSIDDETEAEFSQNPEDEVVKKYYDTLADTSLTPANGAMNKVTLDQIDTLLEPLLTPEQRRIVELRLGLIDGIEGTLAEIASRFCVSRENIRQKLQTAYHKLRGDDFIRELHDAEIQHRSFSPDYNQTLEAQGTQITKDLISLSEARRRYFANIKSYIDSIINNFDIPGKKDKIKEDLEQLYLQQTQLAMIKCQQAFYVAMQSMSPKIKADIKYTIATTENPKYLIGKLREYIYILENNFSEFWITPDDQLHKCIKNHDVNELVNIMKCYIKALEKQIPSED